MDGIEKPGQIFSEVAEHKKAQILIDKFLSNILSLHSTEHLFTCKCMHIQTCRSCDINPVNRLKNFTPA